MSTDYSKKKNAELVEILKSRSLPHTGNKAEMVSRLQEDDKAKATAAPTTAAKTDAAEDVIDWEDDAIATETAPVKPSTEAGAAAIAAGGQGSVPNPVAVPNQQLAEDPATTDDLKVEAPGSAPDGKVAAPEAETAAPTEDATAAQPEKPAVDYTKGLPSTELEEELKKRKARAEKFGIVEDTKTALEEAEKALQRAKRFGTATEAAPTVGVNKLDAALPDERPRKRGRGDTENSNRGNKRRDFGGRNRNRRGGNATRSQNQSQRQGGGQGNAGQTAWSDKDALALEARKKRFATAA